MAIGGGEKAGPVAQHLLRKHKEARVETDRGLVEIDGAEQQQREYAQQQGMLPVNHGWAHGREG